MFRLGRVSLLLILLTFSAPSRGTPEGPSCAQGAPLSEIERWAKATAGNANAGAVLDGGTVLDASCLKGLSDRERGARVARLNAAIRFANEQADRCFKIFRFPDVTNVRGTLSHLTLECHNLGSANGDATLEQQLGYRPFMDLFKRNNIMTRSYDHSYLSSINIGVTSDLDNGRVTDVAKTLFHEALHNFSNNTTWHDQTQTKASTGCTNSFYEDRLYFLAGTCFPSSATGINFHNSLTGSAACPNVCDKALQAAPKELKDSYSVIYRGDILAAEEIPPAERKIMCKHVSRAYWRRRGQFIKPGVISEAASKLVRTLNLQAPFSKLVNLQALNGKAHFGSVAAALREFDRLRSDVDREIDRVCQAQEMDPDCLTGRIQIKGAIDRMRAHLAAFEDEDFLLYRYLPDPAPGVPPPIQQLK